MSSKAFTRLVLHRRASTLKIGAKEPHKPLMFPLGAHLMGPQKSRKNYFREDGAISSSMWMGPPSMMLQREFSFGWARLGHRKGASVSWRLEMAPTCAGNPIVLVCEGC